MNFKFPVEIGKIILIEIQNGHPEEMPLKRIRYDHDSLDTKVLNKGDTYTRLPDIVSLVYTTEPLKYHDTGHTVNDLAFIDLKTGQIAEDYGIRILLVNGKYKNNDSKDFSDVIEDLQKPNSEDIKSPVIKDIHLRTKNTEKGRTMLSQFIEERYGDIIRDYEEQHQKDQEQLQRDQEQLQKKDEEIQKYKNILKNNGIVVE